MIPQTRTRLEMSTHEWNRLHVESTAGPAICQASQGDKMLFVGLQWNHWCVPSPASNSSPFRPPLDPVVHKSPDPVLPWEGRVTLVMDVELQ